MVISDSRKRDHVLTVAVVIGLLAMLASALDARAEAPRGAAHSIAVVVRLEDEAVRAIMAFYDYDRSIPLEARVAATKHRDGFMRQKIVFRGVQGFLVPGYLQMPASHAEPFPCVLLLHGWSGSKEKWWQDDNYISGGNMRKALLQAGYAVLALDAQCHGERMAENDYFPVNYEAAEEDVPRKRYFTQNDIYVQTARDYRRAIDYLASREDIDAERIGVLGYSMGGTQAYLLTGVEPRIKVSVAVATPREASTYSPIAPQNFIRAVGERPFLSIMGDNDTMCPVAHARGRHALFQSPRAKLRIVAGGHRLTSDWVPDAVAWIKQHL